jgi:hypothetical protein
VARGQGRGPKSLARRSGVRQPRKTLLVFCEGTRTEPEYLEALKREPEIRDVAAVDLRIALQAGMPLELVRLAVAARERSIEEEGEIDEVWCVFDVEWPINHPDLKEALALARKRGVRVAVSNPCFELWLALHFRDHRGWLDNNGARRLRRSCDGQVKKGLKGADYMPYREVARQRAAALDRQHEQDCRDFPQNNPSSGMHRLIASVAGSR